MLNVKMHSEHHGRLQCLYTYVGRKSIQGIFLATLLLVAFGGSARADDLALVPGHEPVAVASDSVRLTFDSPPDLAQTSLAVFTTSHQPVAVGALHTTSDPLSLSADLPTLDPGVYTVIWRSTTAAGPRHTLSGTYAFQYDSAEASPRVLVQPQPRFTLPSIDRVVPRWLVYTAILTCIGSLLLRLVVWSRLLRDRRTRALAASAWQRSVERRLTLVTTAAMLLFVPGYFTSPGAGPLWILRLALIALTSASFALAVLPIRRSTGLRGQHADKLFVASLAMSALELLVRTLPSDLTSDTGRTVVNWLLDWSHLVGAAVWVGGLIGLAATASLLRPGRGAPAYVARGVIRRFSNLAIICVGTLTISGTWSAWIHVGSPELLLTTLYGRTLLLKLAVVAILLVLGGLNLLHVLPRLEAARRADADQPSLITAALRHFRRLVILEAVLGLVVLAIVPFLAGSARTQDAQLRSANLTQTATVGSLPVTLRPSALQPGLVDYDLTLPSTYTGRVSLTFDSPELGVPPTDVVAVASGNGTYRASGLYTPMIGDWQVRVQLSDGSATFELPVRADPVAPPPNRAPVIDSSTLALGLIEIVAVVGSLLLASKLSVAIGSILLTRPRQGTAR